MERVYDKEKAPFRPSFILIIAARPDGSRAGYCYGCCDSTRFPGHPRPRPYVPFRYNMMNDEEFVASSVLRFLHSAVFRSGLDACDVRQAGPARLIASKAKDLILA